MPVCSPKPATLYRVIFLITNSTASYAKTKDRYTTAMMEIMPDGRVKNEKFRYSLLKRRRR